MSENKIEFDLYGAALSQTLLDKVYGQAMMLPSGTIDIVLKNIDAKCLPRMFVDYGQIYEAVELLLKEREQK